MIILLRNTSSTYLVIPSIRGRDTLVSERSGGNVSVILVPMLEKLCEVHKNVWSAAVYPICMMAFVGRVYYILT